MAQPKDHSSAQVKRNANRNPKRNVKALVLTGSLRAPEGALAAILAALPEHIQRTRQEPGCLWFDVRQRAAEPQVFDVSEGFISQAAFTAHQNRIRGTAWEAATREAKREYSLWPKT